MRTSPLIRAGRRLLAGLGLMLAVAAPAAAGDGGLHGELSVELGTLANHDPSFDLFSRNDLMPSRGVRAGIALSDGISLVGGWHRVRRGATVYLGEGQQLRTAFFADQFTFGPKAQVGLFRDRVLPYLLTQALVHRGVIKLDDDPNTRHNPGQVRESAVTPGVLGMAGLELRTGTRRDRSLAAALFLEMGYGWSARGQYGELGSMRPGGFALRSGVGLRF